MVRRAIIMGGLLVAGSVFSQTLHPSAYDMGTPNVVDFWVDPVSGNDGNSGLTRTQAFQSVTAAWNSIPMGSTLTNGYRINLVAGTHTNRPNYWESRYGTYTNPVIIHSVDGDGTAIMDTMNIFDCRYLYLMGIHLEIGGGDVLHLDSCDHVLLRNVEVVGTGDISIFDCPQEGLKVNQSQYLYVEGCDISGAWDNAVDCVAVQYGHFITNRIHRSGDWCMYLKGGSAYFTVEENEYYDGGTGGFTAGQGTGFEYMVNPWIHYEAYDIKFINNVVHHTGTAGIGVNGGYNILIAYNTLYKAGTNDHVMEVVHGSRSCDGDTVRCASNNAAGGWGGSGIDAQFIPSRNVYIYNNLIYNPAGSRSDWNQFTVAGETTPPGGSNVSTPDVVDTNLYIRGNLIWNGPPDMTNLDIFSGGGCDPSNPSCNETLVSAENTINLIEPQLVDPENGDYRPVEGGNVYNMTTYPISNFPGGDRPSTPSSPEGNLTNNVTLDYSRVARSTNDVPGAFADGFETELVSLNLTGSSSPVISWTSATNLTYALSRSTNLLTGFTVNVRTQLSGDPPLNIVTDATATGSGPYFYRIRTE